MWQIQVWRGSYTISSKVEAEITVDAATGYYKLVPGRTYWEVKADCHDNSSPYSNIYYLDMPYGDPTIFTAFSTDNYTWEER